MALGSSGLVRFPLLFKANLLVCLDTALRRRLVLLPRRLLPLSVLVAGLVVGGSFVGSQSLVAWKRVPRGTLLCFVSGRAESWAHNLSEHP